MSDSSIATAKIAGIYNNVACLFVSTDEKGEAWVHFGVELRGQGSQRQPYLSTFGGAIDINSEGKTETPMQALTRELHEEALGLLDNEVTLEKLSNPNLTYSFIYTHPTTLSATVVFALQIDHEKIELINKQFEIERSEKIYQQNNKKFTSQAETEIKEIRSVKLSELKNHLTATKDDTTKAIICAAEPSFSLNLDQNSIKLNEKNELVDYQIWMQDNTPVTTPIPAALPIRLDVIKSLIKLLPGLEYRFFNTPIISNKQPIELGFYGKSLRADQFCFIEEFFDTLPIKGLTQQQRVSEKRIGRRDPFTARGTELIDATLKTEYGIAQQYTEQQKAEFSEFQSLSYFSVPHGTPVFGWGKNRQDCLLGIAHIDMLPNRFFIYDGGTVERPYDDKNIDELKEYVQRNALSNEPLFFDVSDLENFKKKVDSLGNQKYNEILGRLRWDIDHTCICVFSDNETTLWIAIAWAQKIENKIKQKSLELYQNKEISEEQYIKFNSYQSKIAYYNPTNKKTGYYTESQIDQFKKSAYALYDTLALRTQYYQAKNYEFLLLIDEKEKLAEILSDQTLMRTIMHTRLYIAETLIEKYYTQTKKPFILTGTAPLQLENITRSFLEKLINGVITGLPLDSDQKIILDGFTIANKDLSGMNLSKFNFNGCHLEKCHLKAVTLNIQGHEKVTFTKCDFSNTSTITCDFSSAKFIDDCIFQKNEVNIQLYEKINENYFRNFDITNMMNSLKTISNPSDKYICFIFKLAIYHHDYKAATELLEQFDVFKLGISADLHTSIDHVTLLMHAAEKGNEALTLLLIKNGAYLGERTDFHGETAVDKAAKKGHLKIIELLIQAGALNNFTSANKALSKATRLFKAHETIITKLRAHLSDIIAGNPDALNTYVDTDKTGHNPLTAAINNLDIELAKIMITQNPKLALYVLPDGSNAGYNALNFAILKQYRFNDEKQLIKLIIEKSPESALYVITKSSNDIHNGHNALTLAIKKEYIDLAKQIVEKAPQSALHVIKGHNALTLAIKEENIDLAKQIVEKAPASALHVITNGYGDKGHNALTLTIKEKNIDLAKQIVEKAPASALHVITNNYTYGGHNALTLTIKEKNIDLAKQIVEKAPQSALHVITDDYKHKGHNALTLAMANDDTELCQLILSHSPDSALHVVTEIYHYTGHNALTLAIKNKNIELAKKIAEKAPQSALHVITDNYHYYEGYNALTLAIEIQDFELAKLIVQKTPQAALQIIGQWHYLKLLQTVRSFFPFS